MDFLTCTEWAKLYDNCRRKPQDYHNVPSHNRLEEKSKPCKSEMSGDNVHDSISEDDLNRYASKFLQDIESNESSPGSYKTGVDDEAFYCKKIPNCFPPSYQVGKQPKNQQESFLRILHAKPPFPNDDTTKVDCYSNMQLPPGHSTIMVPNNQSKQGIVEKNVPRGCGQKKNQTQINMN